ncbi:MAG: pyruvate dehydrogenase (acetyl-transferring) E1 component subunit alpha [Anaerolineae bacterium]|jgi:pyruvate dehydrogenase E1 component alpha subunit|nr:pyruvate dehydrogenase (acetyl-transferring) E1 component subunit alpha [Anaerolineae bacterium]
MPREVIEIPSTIEYLTILDQDGGADPALEPELSDEFLLSLHRWMLLGRRFDERMLRLQRQGRIGTFAPVMGQEAANVGAAAALRQSDWMVVAFREAAGELMRGRTMEDLLLYYGGYNEGGTIPEGVNNLPTSIPVGSQALHAVGLAWGIKYRGKDDVAMVFFGDGATSQGDFHEALNFAGVYKVPTVFVCQNNQWAISVPRSRQTAALTLAQKGLAHGVPGIQVDGNDVLAVYVAAREAIERARAGEGATLIEAVTYRMSVHTTADDPKRYRTDEEVEVWRQRDPINRFQIYLRTKGLLDDEKLAGLEEDIDQQIREAVERAEKTMSEPVDPLVMFDHLYAESYPHLVDQRRELADALSDKES